VRVRVNDSAGVFYFAAREQEAEQLLRAGMAKPLGRPGKKVRCLQLQCSRKQAHTFLRGGRTFGQVSKTTRIERVGDKRLPLYQHIAERCLEFRPELKVTTSRPCEPEVERPEPICTESVQIPEPEVLQVIPDERGADAEREPERVPVEPETLDVAEPAKQPHDSTIPADPNDMSGLRKLAAAVLVRAFEDARTDSRARQWFEVTPQPMLTFWCQVVGLDVGTVRKRALVQGAARTV
jgi:hypothetical protein